MRYRQYRAHFTKKEVQPITGKVKTAYVGAVDFWADKSDEPLAAIAYRRANRQQQDSTLIEIVEL